MSPNKCSAITALYQALVPRLAALGLQFQQGRLPKVGTRHSTHQVPIVPPARSRYLAEIAETVRAYKRHARDQARRAREVQQLDASATMLQAASPEHRSAAATVMNLANARRAGLDAQSTRLLAMWPDMLKAYGADEYVVRIRDKEIRTSLVHTTLSGNKIRKVALPAYEDQRTRQFSVHRRNLRVQTRERRPNPHVCG